MDERDDIDQLRDSGDDATNVVSLDRRRNPPRRPVEGRPPERASEKRRGGKITAAQKRSKVLALRAAGGSYPGIAAVLTEQGYPTTAKAVGRILHRALEELRTQDTANVELVRAQQLDRLDRMLQAIWLKVKQGDIKAVHQATNIERLRAEIAGTKVPRKVEHSGHVDHRVTYDEVAQLEEAWRNEGAIDLGDDDVTVLESTIIDGDRVLSP